VTASSSPGNPAAIGMAAAASPWPVLIRGSQGNKFDKKQETIR
jgi:hypothetical protein